MTLKADETLELDKLQSILYIKEYTNTKKVHGSVRVGNCLNGFPLLLIHRCDNINVW